MVRLATFGAILLWAFITAALSNVADLAARPNLPKPVVAVVEERYPGAIIVRADLEKQAKAVYRLKLRHPSEPGRTVSFDAWITIAGDFVQAERPAARHESRTALLKQPSWRVE